jgi:uncharacterized membrane protein YjjB (DUF3815 family)
MGSSKFSLNSQDMIKLAKNAGLVAAASALSYIGQNLSHADLGPATAFIVPVVAFALDGMMKWVKDNTKE